MSCAPDCSIVICVESGSLEYKAFLLIETLRRNWGSWSTLPVYAYAPRPGKSPSSWLLEVYSRYQVTPVDVALNTEFVDYPLANKPLAMAHAEATLDSKYLLFLDTDTLCWQPPDAFCLADQVDMALCVDTTKTVASSGPGDQYEAMWQKLFRSADLHSQPPYVVTHLTRERVRSWWISSVILCRREAGVMNEWLTLFRQVARDQLFVREALYLREQMVLCAVAARLGDRLADLPLSHNYPIQNYTYYASRGIHPLSAALWHYQPYLGKFFRKFSAAVDAARTVDEKVSVAQRYCVELRTRYPKLLGMDETRVQHWRRRLRLGPRLRQILGVSRPSDRTATDF
jgi:hypothetical protein